MPRGWRNTTRITVQFDNPIAAPVRQGAPIGKLVIEGKSVPPVPEMVLVAGADVPRLSLPGRAVAVAAHFLTGA